MSYKISFDTTFKHNPYKGQYIALEGIDGSGKTTQVGILKKYFEDNGRKVVTVRFPRREQGLLAEVNAYILKGESSMPKSAFQYLFSADYAMLEEEIIIPALKEGHIVLADRFHCWSSVTYGMWDTHKTYSQEIVQSLMVANGLLSKHIQFYVPDITFYLTVSIQTALSRISMKKGKDIYEKEEILREIVTGYNWLMDEFPASFSRVDAEGSIDAVTMDMIEKIENSRRDNKN